MDFNNLQMEAGYTEVVFMMAPFTVPEDGFELEYDLSEDLWWYLYRQKQSYKDLYVQFKPVLEDGDCLRYLINGNLVKPLGKYTLEQLKKEDKDE